MIVTSKITVKDVGVNGEKIVEIWNPKNYTVVFNRDSLSLWVNDFNSKTFFFEFMSVEDFNGRFELLMDWSNV